MTRRRKRGSGARPPAGARRRRARSQVRNLVIGLMLLTLAVAAIWTIAGPGPAARQGASTTVILEPGSGLAKIAAALKAGHVIRSSLAFMAVSKLTSGGRTLKAGEYAVPSRASMGRILKMLRSGQVVRHFVTIPEGLTSAQAAAVLDANPVLTGQAEPPPEGSLLPETYEVQRGSTRQAALARMHAAQDRLMAELWPGRRADLPFDTPDKALVLASIVEKETGLATERPRVAAVFVNRLKLHMPLGSDPTVVYGLSKGVPLGHGLRQSELAQATAYNTYRFAGLPPTPIANPGKAAIQAVLNPADTPDLYFVADGTGGHAFAATMAEHEKNVARWRKIEQDRVQAAPAPATGAAQGAPNLRGTHAR